MNRRRKKGETEIPRPDSETKNDGEIKRHRLLHSRIKLEGSDVKTCHVFS